MKKNGQLLNNLKSTKRKMALVASSFENDFGLKQLRRRFKKIARDNLKDRMDRRPILRSLTRLKMFVNLGNLD